MSSAKTVSGTPDAANQQASPVDTVDPTTSLLFPGDGSTVTSNAVTLSGTAQDNVGVDRVELTVQNTGTGQWLQADGSFGPADYGLPGPPPPPTYVSLGLITEVPAAPETGMLWNAMVNHAPRPRKFVAPGVSGSAFEA